MRLGAAMLIGAATLLSACAEQAGGYAPTNVSGSYNPYYGYSAPAYPGYEPGYYGPGYYGPGVVIGGGSFWGNDQDRSWYHRHGAWDGDRSWQEQEFLRHQNEAQTQAQASLQLQQQRAQALAAQAQASLQLQQQTAQAALQLQQQKAAQVQAWQLQQQQRVQALAAQNQAILQQRAAMQAAQQHTPR